MYKHLKSMIGAAESVGNIKSVRQTEEDRFYGNEIKITGTTEDGKEFELELTIREKKDDRN